MAEGPNFFHLHTNETYLTMKQIMHCNMWVKLFICILLADFSLLRTNVRLGVRPFSSSTNWPIFTKFRKRPSQSPTRTTVWWSLMTPRFSAHVCLYRNSTGRQSRVSHVLSEHICMFYLSTFTRYHNVTGCICSLRHLELCYTFLLSRGPSATITSLSFY
jgi:hypothetical protein